MNADVNTIASVVSAVCAVIGVLIGAMGLSRPNPSSSSTTASLISVRTLYAFLLTTSGWVLAVLSALWVFEPFGPYVTDREYFQIVGVMVALPAMLILRTGMRLLDGAKAKDTSGSNVDCSNS